jgi:hypothetical protein
VNRKIRFDVMKEFLFGTINNTVLQVYESLLNKMQTATNKTTSTDVDAEE